jgi:hypothetical protein
MGCDDGTVVKQNMVAVCCARDKKHNHALLLQQLLTIVTFVHVGLVALAGTRSVVMGRSQRVENMLRQTADSVSELLQFPHNAPSRTSFDRVGVVHCDARTPGRTRRGKPFRKPK